MKNKQLKITKKDKARIINEIKEEFERSLKEIDECPFIQKKMNIFWKLAGGKKPQADYLKEELLERTKIIVSEI